MQLQQSTIDKNIFYCEQSHRLYWMLFVGGRSQDKAVPHAAVECADQWMTAFVDDVDKSWKTERYDLRELAEPGRRSLFFFVAGDVSDETLGELRQSIRDRRQRVVV